MTFSATKQEHSAGLKHTYIYEIRTSWDIIWIAQGITQSKEGISLHNKYINENIQIYRNELFFICLAWTGEWLDHFG